MSQRFIILVLLLALLSGCGYDRLQATDEPIKAVWEEVLVQYQHRIKLIPGFVNTVKGYASHEMEVLMEVTNSRARVSAIQASPELINDKEAFKQYTDAQGDMMSALSSLLLVAERHPGLKEDGVFRDLLTQLENTEHRISTARNQYVKVVQTYNETVRVFPSNVTALIFGFDTKPTLNVENKAVLSKPKPPRVDYGPSLPDLGAGFHPASVVGPD
jgi:LemA protein